MPRLKIPLAGIGRALLLALKAAILVNPLLFPLQLSFEALGKSTRTRRFISTADVHLFGADERFLSGVRVNVEIMGGGAGWRGSLTTHAREEFDLIRLDDFMRSEVVLALRQGEVARIELLDYSFSEVFVDGRGHAFMREDLVDISGQEIAMAYSETPELTIRFVGHSSPPQPRAASPGDSDFCDLATQHQRLSALWQGVAFMAYIGSGALGFGLFFALDFGEGTAEIISFTAAKAGASAALVGVGIYSARLAAFHRTLSDDNRGIAEVLRVKQLDGLTPQELNAEIQKTVALFRASRDKVQLDLPVIEVGRIFLPAGPKDSTAQTD